MFGGHASGGELGSTTYGGGVGLLIPQSRHRTRIWQAGQESSKRLKTSVCYCLTAASCMYEERATRWHTA
jgi:hypothetical protein